MRSFSILICVLLVTSFAFAQSDRGTITGTVSDPAGAVVANAAVEAKNTETGAVYSSATTGTGNYTIAQLPAGPYTVSVSVPGFKKYSRSGLQVLVAQILRIDISLEVGSATESVTVTEAASLLNTETAEVSHSVTARAMNDLPILGIGASQAGSAGIRNPMAVVQLIPGATYVGGTVGKVNGAPGSSQSFRIEGMDASNSGTPGSTQQNQPSVDSIQEFAIQTSNYAAEYGQVGGGYFNVTMKSGTNQFHGTGYDYFVNEVFNAGTPYTGAPAGTGNPRARNRRQDYGFTLGGPVFIPKVYDGRNKTFFFFNWEQYRETVDINNQLETVPTAAYRLGNFSAAQIGNAIGTDPLGRPIFQGEIYDPSTQRAAPTSGQIVRDPFVGQQIPVTSFDPVAARIQALFPQPLGPNASSVVNNFVPNIPTSRVTSIPSFKIDQAIGSKGKLSFFYNRTNTVAPLSFTFGMVDGLPDPLATNRGTFTSAPLYRLNYDYALSPTMLLHFGAGYRQTNFYDPSVDEEGNPVNFNAQQLVGLNGGTTHNFFPDFAGVCTPGPGTGSCTGQGGMQIFGSTFYAHSYTQSPTFNSSATWVRGNHTYKFGAEFRTEGYPGSSLSGTGGSYTFSGNQTSLPYLNGQTLTGGQTPGFAYASFLLGDVNQVSINNPVTARIGKNQTGVYAQDSWKITRKLTFDYGIRYDYSTYLQETYGRAPDFSPTTLNPAVGLPGAVIFEGDLPGHCQCNFAKNYPLAFSPRLGLAYQITPKTVFRGGFGIVYNGTENNNNSGAGSSVNVVAAPTFGGNATTLAVGIPTSFNPPAWPNLNPGQYNAAVNGVISPIASPANLIDPNAGRPPRMYQWSAGFQREIMRDLAVEVSYIGNRGIWWQAPGKVNYNALSLSALAADGININSPTDVALLSMPISSAAVVARGFKVPYAGFPTSSSLGQALRPFPQFTTINTLWAPLGDNWYDALQVKATKRLSHGLSFVSTFTWSKTLVSGGETGDPLTAANGVINDVFNRPNNKTLSSTDQPFFFNISATYVTPAVHTNKILSWVVRDWTYGAYLQYASGTPIQVPLANNNLSTALFQTTNANRVPGVPLYTVDLNCHCYDPNKTFALNPAAWTDPPAGQFGTSAAYYSDYRTQRRPQENMNLGRTWRVKENMTFNLRFEVTDAFNRGHYNNPTSTNAKAPQTLQANGNAASGFGWLSPATAAAPRNGLVVGRFTF